MKIALTADIHMGITPIPIVWSLIKQINDISPDYLIVAGDIGEPFTYFIDVLDILTACDCPVGIIAGNHDVWATEGYNSQQLWETEIPKAVATYDFDYLEQTPAILDNTAILGTIGWYDYSAKSAACFYSDDQLWHRKYKVNNDAKYVNWPWTDKEFAELCRQKFISRLQKLDKDSEIEHIIVATHVPVFPEMQPRGIVYSPESNVYFYNYTLGNDLDNFKKINFVFSAHTHHGVYAIHTCKDERKINAWVSNSDYLEPKVMVYNA